MCSLSDVNFTAFHLFNLDYGTAMSAMVSFIMNVMDSATIYGITTYNVPHEMIAEVIITTI